MCLNQDMCDINVSVCDTEYSNILLNFKFAFVLCVEFYSV